MPAVTAYAPGKIILLGEHAVVYGRPAIAVPVTQVHARATVFADPGGKPGEVWFSAPDIGLDSSTRNLSPDHPLSLAAETTRELLRISQLPAMRIQISSTIPIASGLGSGAAVSAAVARALSDFLGHPLNDEQVSAVAFRVDQHYHGTPSGIDNTVIAYAQPVFFVRGQPFERLVPGHPFTVVIGNTGISSPTKAVVADVRRGWEAYPDRFEGIFDAIGALTRKARTVIEHGVVEDLGECLTENQQLLQMIGVSSADLDRLVETAIASGALGAKLCGGGRGGNMIALVEARSAVVVAAALREAGAVNTIITTISG